MSDPKPADGVDKQALHADELLSATPSETKRLPWSPPTLTDFGAVSDVTQGISYTPNDGISNRCI